MFNLNGFRGIGVNRPFRHYGRRNESGRGLNDEPMEGFGERATNRHKKKNYDHGHSSMVVFNSGEEWNRTINQGLMSPLLYH